MTQKADKPNESDMAIVRVERILLAEFDWNYITHLTINAQSFGDRVRKAGESALTFSLSNLVRGNRPELSQRLRFLSLRGMSRDRIDFLSEEFYKDVLKPKVLPGGRALLEDLYRQKKKIYLFSTSLKQPIESLARDLGFIEGVYGNSLEFDGRFCTGRLLEPIFGTLASRTFWDQELRQKGKTTAVGADSSDLSLLEVSGSPITINPSSELRSYAERSGWQILEYS